MVDQIKKLETDRFRVQHKEDPTDDQGSQQQGQGEEEERDGFERPARYDKVLADERKSTGRHASLWSDPPRPSAQAVGPGEIAPTIEAPLLREEITETDALAEETTFSTTITFLKAAGLVDASGRPRFSFILLYGLALIGFIATTIFLLKILL